ncbi:peptide chain release factor N(5)-glutamine methyltransferase [Thiomicrorhabdus sp. zzn3]|uniref:peptide chain release factor N(5)-glutamine methyltransferase n=1 Tax=Thiomicrorhabdus sp. zzn3 TaxID=3039775 RepID=UPI0024373332|nr:peptide chain release factor N(5)-glutamine methyltransferase [Thiomicrorhabdus sp. zzn3]MDG6779125.1 peptide chain release factor N(5)-glutamine methyltransferase [Thiomicrorhabdus sp. zzn3]
MKPNSEDKAAGTIEQTLKSARSRLTDSQISDSPGLDAELLLAHCLQTSRTYLFTWPEIELNESQQACFNSLLQKRLQGHPIAHLTGEREFWGLSLKVTPDTLIPRPDTEILVETALQKIEQLQQTEQACSDCRPPSPIRLLDLGTGTGAIALALKQECPQCDVTALDQSGAALEVARYNAQIHNLSIRFLKSDWFSVLDANKRFSVIVSNPPYIENNDPHLQQGDVRFDPISALTSGEDGLQDLKFIIQQAWSFLQPDGWLLVEHGYNQAEAVSALFQQRGYQQIENRCDYGGNPRITFGQKPCTSQTG